MAYSGKGDECDFVALGDGKLKMTVDDFRQSLTQAEPPPGLSLAGLWWDAKNDWTQVHESAQQDEGVEGSWVHAYRHRKEGDQNNPEYWYGRAGGKARLRRFTGGGMAQHRESVAWIVAC